MGRASPAPTPALQFSEFGKLSFLLVSCKIRAHINYNKEKLPNGILSPLCLDS